jgi:hypothetical protein
LFNNIKNTLLPATKFQWNGSMLLGQPRRITITRTQRNVAMYVHLLSRSLLPASDTVPPISYSSNLTPYWCLVGSRNHEVPHFATWSSLLVKASLILTINYHLNVYTLLARMVTKVNKDRDLACRLWILCITARQTFWHSATVCCRILWRYGTVGHIFYVRVFVHH